MGTTRNLEAVATRESTFSRGSKTNSGSRKRKSRSGGFLSALKSAFSGGTDDSSSARSRSVTRTRSRRLSSGFMLSSAQREEIKEQEREEREEAEREARRSKCMAIKVAKREPIAIQNLLVDCEFCNPPPKYGVDYPIVSPEFTADDNPGPPGPGEVIDEADERTWNVGLDEWLRIREKWLEPNADSVNPHHLSAEVTSDKYYAIYDKMIHHTRPLKHPLNLTDMIKIIRAGWVSEGTWPSQADPNDVWSTSDEEVTKPEPEHNLSDVPSEDTASDRVRHAHGSSRSRSRSATPGAISQSAIASTTNSSVNSLRSPSSRDEVPQLLVSGVEPSPSQSSSLLSPQVSAGGTRRDPSQTPVVQFSERPHPRRQGSDLKSGLPQLERLVSGMSMTQLRPTRSEASSLVSMTDSD